jgi:MFS family permease
VSYAMLCYATVQCSTRSAHTIVSHTFVIPYLTVQLFTFNNTYSNANTTTTNATTIIAGHALREYEHRSVLGVSFGVFTLLTVLWALTPTHWAFSSRLFIFERFLMGLCQCICCVFFPLWTNDFAPRRSTASWMSMLQASVPFGVMAGYIIASIILRFEDADNLIFGMACWRIPLLIEGVSLIPFSIAIFFIPRQLITVRVTYDSPDDQLCALDTASHGSAGTLAGYGSFDTLAGEQLSKAVPMTPERAGGRSRWYSDDFTATGLSLAGGSTASVTPLRLKRRPEDQRKSYRRLRQSSMAASLYDSMSARDVLRDHDSSLAILDSKDDNYLGMLSSGGLRWVDRRRAVEDMDEEEDEEEESGARSKYFLQLDKWENKVKEFFRKDKDKNKGPASASADAETGDTQDTPTAAAEGQGQGQGQGEGGSNPGSMYRSWSMPAEPTAGAGQGQGKRRAAAAAAGADLEAGAEAGAGAGVESEESDPFLHSSPSPVGNMSARSDSFASEPELVQGTASEVVDSDGNRIVDMSSISLYGAACVLFKMPVYRSVVLSMSALYFVVTGVQFWGTSYLIIGLKAPVIMVQCFFIFVAATAPTSGVIFGGWYVDAQGGYKGIKQRYIALKFCFAIGSLGLFWAVLTIFTTNFYLVVTLLWLVLFCGGATLPGCSGIAVSVVPRPLRAYSSSISLVIFNLFGYFLSVALSGSLMQVATLHCMFCILCVLHCMCFFICHYCLVYPFIDCLCSFTDIFTCSIACYGVL